MLVLKPGGHIHQTDLGDLHLDREVDPRVLDDSVSEMSRRGLEPNDIVGATVEGNRIEFQLREPLSQ